MKKFSIVLPIYGNEKNIPVTVPYILDRSPVLFPNYDIEIIMVNDGSPDNSYEIMKEYQRQYPEIIKIASFTRNFGQYAAWNYGMALATGDVVGVISADLQEPFDLFADMLQEWENGYEFVCARRESRSDKHHILPVIAHFIIRKLCAKNYPKGGFDFFVISRNALQEYLKINEKNGSPQLLMLWFGFQSKSIPYERTERKIGKSGFTFSKRLKELVDAVITNSYFPMRAMSVIGGISALGGFLYGFYIVVSTIVSTLNDTYNDVLGWPSIVTIIIFFSGLILMSLGIMGEYIWRIFDYVKQRPPYVVKEIIDEIPYKEITIASQERSEPEER